MYKTFARLAGAVTALALPLLASAHEVYVLTPAEIQLDVASPSFSWLAVISNDLHSFLAWTFIAILSVLFIFALSIFRPFERMCNPWLATLKRYALHISRVTVGLAFLAAAYYQASYGPELPFSATWGAYSPAITVLFVLMGLLITFNLFTRLAAIAALLVFAVNVYFHGWYMLTYTNYLGEIFVLLLLGSEGKRFMGRSSFFRTLRERLDRLGRAARPYAFLILRVSFGISLLYAAVYAKVVNDSLALDVASGHGIVASVTPHARTVAETLGFEPHFLVVGAGIVEIVVALFFIFGIEIRFISLFLEFWLGLSLWYFGEAAWPHLVLIGIPIAFLFHGYDKYSLESLLFRRHKREPVL